MFELKGKHGMAKVFTDNCDNETVSQITTLLNQPFAKDTQIRIMPDCHAGKGCVVGTTMTLTDKVVPNLVGVDIGCFTGDTEVWCSGGFYKTIKELAEQNKTFLTDAWDEENHAFVIASATAFKTRSNADLVKVTYKKETTFKNQECEIQVRCTPDHKFLTCYENSHKYYYSNDTFIWKDAEKLTCGDRLWAEDSVVVVVDVEKLDEKEDVYCLNVPDYHNFSIRHGVIVHNCGMLATRLEETEIDLAELDKVINEYVPSGFSIHDRAVASFNDLNNLYCDVNKINAEKSIGSLGGGNHFIELDKDKDGQLWLVIHCGSRHLGIEVCNHYQKEGYKALKDNANQNKIATVIAELKAAGRQTEIEQTIKQLKMEQPVVPESLAYVEGTLFEQYIHDMHLTQQYAKKNRQTITDIIISKMGLYPAESFDTIHNYIDTEHMILRKGSISAQNGEKVIIPMNMRDGSLICIGKGNPDWNFSAPHGAGRIMSRSQAKDNVDMNEFKEAMTGIYSTSVCQSTVDEAPQVYKPMNEIIKNIQDTVDVVDIIKPVYNFKAH